MSIIKSICRHWWHRAPGYVTLSAGMLGCELGIGYWLLGKDGLKALIDGSIGAMQSVDVGRLLVYVTIIVILATYALGWIYEFAVRHNNFAQAGLLALKKYFGYLAIVIIAGILIEVGLALFYLPGIVMAVWLFMLPYYFARYNKITVKGSFQFGHSHFWPLFGLVTGIVIISLIISSIQYLSFVVDLILFGLLASATAVFDAKRPFLSKRD